MSYVLSGEDSTSLYTIPLPGNFICIEGHTASGKTTAGNLLAQHLNAHFIDTDNFIGKTTNENKSYVERLDLDALLTEIKGHTGKKVMVGICLRETLERLDINDEIFYIYIKVISEISNTWIEKYNLEDFENGKMETEKVPIAHLDSYKYTLKYKPQELADVVFKRLI